MRPSQQYMVAFFVPFYRFAHKDLVSVNSLSVYVELTLRGIEESEPREGSGAPRTPRKTDAATRCWSVKLSLSRPRRSCSHPPRHFFLPLSFPRADCSSAWGMELGSREDHLQKPSTPCSPTYCCGCETLKLMDEKFFLISHSA